ncbi:MAG TPA: zinc-binding dehydrogenase [Rugosimonospora sp.]|nr:zinc-binding dehydrogenase [Rugosimonospora sp.]
MPVPAGGEVLVRIEAVGLHYAETRARAGAFPAGDLPRTVGIEGVGTVADVGDGVHDGLVGTRVLVILVEGMGTWAEYVTAPVTATVPVPDGLAAVAAVGTGLSAGVALALVRAGRVAGGESVLVEAAGGAIGGYLVQFARAAGAGRIVATAGSQAKREQARKLGADVVVDHRESDWRTRVPGGLDVVFESIGGTDAVPLLDALTPGTGRMVFYGLLSGEALAVTPMDLLVRGVTLVGFGGRPSTGLARVARELPEVLAAVARGRLLPLVDQVLPLSQAAQAHRRMEQREAVGKLVLATGGDARH